MSRKKFTYNLDFNPIYVRLLSVQGLKNQSKIAESIEIKDQAITNYKSKNKWPIETLYKLAVRHNLSLDWLLTGEGPMKLEDSGNNYFVMEQQAAYAVDDPKVTELLRMAREVLASETVYAEALQSNLVAFHRAVTREKIVAVPVDADVDERLKYLENALRVIEGKGGPPGERIGDASRKDSVAAEEPPEGPIGKLGM